MNFECLANELLLDVFEYLSSVHLLRTFYNLNHRFNQLLFIHFQRFSLDFRSISQYDFNLISDEYLPNLTDHIQSLILSNNDDTPQQIDLFFEHNLTFNQFHNLQSLSLYDLCSNELIIKIIFELKSLPNLIRLTLAGCYLQLNQIDTQQFIDTIWSLPKLIYCYLNIYFGEFHLFIPTVMSLSLKYLFIWGIEHQQNEINALLKQTPCLQHFSILLNDNDDQPCISLITKLNLGLSSIQENSLIQFFENMPNLSRLTVDLCSLDASGVLNGYQWENIIRNSLPKLEVFRLRMNFQLNQQIDDLFESFETSFWIEEHNWFIRCHWNSTSICLYTLPYVFNDFHFHSSSQFKSTCPDEKNYLYYHRVNELHYTNSSNEKFFFSSPIQFLNINHLTIDLPVDENFWSIVPKLDRITSLYLSINEHDHVQTQLQLLINQIPRLTSLSLNSCQLSILASEIRNVSIRRLDLRGNDQYFNDEQIRSLFGLPCEILFIKIKNRYILMDLMSNLINLRTLNIQCKDDKFNQTNEDEFIVWLKNHLPSTCIVSRDLLFHSDIRIWIR
jgi:hypothetical protein